MGARGSGNNDDDEVMEEEEEEVEEVEEEEDEEMEEAKVLSSGSGKKAKEHMEQLQRLQEKDPEFYEFLKEHDKELLEFNDDIDQDAETDADEEEMQEYDETDLHDKDNQAVVRRMVQEPTKNVITMAMVDSWCNEIKENSKLGAVRSLMRAFRTCCHHGDDGGEEPSSKFRLLSSSVFNKIMLFVLNEMDAIIRRLLKFPASGGKKETVINLKNTRQWKNHGNLVKSYLGNSLHVLNQMTDTEMISFTLRRLRYSAVFLAAFPSFLRKYIKVTLHFWGTGGGALPVVSFLFIRDLCVRLGADCLDECFKGIYKAYVLNCQSINATKLQHLQFLANCVIELCGVDLPTAYQHAFVFIRQLAMVLREALNMKTKESYKKVYGWKFMGCLELWTGAICAYSTEPDFQPLAYPLTQIISGVARMVPTARYFPLRLRCARMLNRIAASTGMFVPLSFLLLDMLEMKELNSRPTGGFGKAVDLHTLVKVQKPVLKTRAFQEACVFSVIEELAEHLAQWSYSIALFELAFIPTVRLRSFCKTTKIERFRREMRELICQIEANAEYTNSRRMTASFLPNDPATASFLEAEKEAGASPLSRYVIALRQRAQQRNNSLVESSVIVGAQSSVFGRKKSESDDEDDVKNEEEGAAAFGSSWLPGSNTKIENTKQVNSKKRKRQVKQKEEVALDEDVVGDLVLSSDEDSMSDTASAEEEDNSRLVSSKPGTQEQKSFKGLRKSKGYRHGKKKPKRRKGTKQAK